MLLMIPCTERFVHALDGFNHTERSTVVRKIRLFVANPTSKSLKVHRYMALENMWEFYVDRRMRVLFERLEGQLHLSDVGFHAILQKACRYRNTSYTHVLHVGEGVYHYVPKQQTFSDSRLPAIVFH
ncbi:hypothetical protein [Dictyobacter kobayashii]|uniref:Uncharacterized protein n=1 Tax=Dictyobacter kobayashii TaxID=2014872 RepID=A0A402APH2_9CHLR|nr:hypothetical protein [Dictyobacter kobayashii]GCE21063.1 hypothetical protein KDK_48630 [Dictyobacter kobayashii]